MSLIRSLVFGASIVCTIFLSSYLILSVFKAYGLFRGAFSYKIILICTILLPIILMVTMTIGSRLYSKINAFLYSISAVYLGILTYLFIAAIILGIFYFFIQGAHVQFLLRPLGLLAIVGVGIMSIYSVVNAARPQVKTFEVENTILGPLWKGKKIVLVSDTHLGLVRGEQFMKKVAQKINAQNPDIVLLAGDMIDGPVIPYEKFSAPFKDIEAQYGVFYTPGNHEWYNSEPQKFISAMDKNTTVLLDKKIEVNNTQIIGLNYQIETNDATKERLSALGFDKTKPSIVIMHDPKNTQALMDSGVSLSVSGHTHCGQFFPFTLLVRSIYKNLTYGVNNFPTGTSVTTCGIGTAGPPFRLGSTPEIVVIHIQ